MPKAMVKERVHNEETIRPVAFKASLVPQRCKVRSKQSQPCPPPQGLFVAYDAITEDVARQAVAYIRQDKFAGSFGKVVPRCKGPNRRAIFGNQTSAHRTPALHTLEAPLLRLYEEAIASVPQFTPAAPPDACTVNVYPTGTGVAAHNDGARFCNDVVGVTLQFDQVKPSAMRFRWDQWAHTVPTPHGSVYVMSGEAYTKWSHERLKTAKGGDVISFTFRSNKKAHTC